MPMVTDVVICPHCRYGERFTLPGPGRVVVNVGDTVTPTDIVGYTVVRGPITLVDLASRLGVSPRQVPEFLVIKEGQSVRADELMAQRQEWLRKREVRAPADSRAMVIGGGMALLEGFPSEEPVRGCLPGRVTEITPGCDLRVEGTGALMVAATSLGEDFRGPLKVVAPVPERVLRPEHIDATVHGSVIVGGVGDDVAALARAAEFGAQGAILGSVPSSWAGGSLPLPVAVVEGFGGVPMNRLAFEAMNELAGRLTYSMRRGRRSWIISPEKAASVPPGLTAPNLTRLEEGQTVHFTAGARAGAIGTVVELLPGSGEAIVKLGSDRVVVPAANCEVVTRSPAPGPAPEATDIEDSVKPTRLRNGGI